MPNRKQEGLPGGDAEADLLRRALDKFTTGVIIVGSQGQVLDLNRSAIALLNARAGLAVDGHRLRAVDPASDRRFQAVISEAIEAVDQPGRCVGILRIPRESSGHPCHVCVVALGANAQRAAALFILDSQQEVRMGTDLLRELFGLSPSEARVVVELMNGRKLREIAQSLSLSVHTVRTHLRAVLSKTGTNSQRDLTRMLALGLGSLHFDR